MNDLKKIAAEMDEYVTDECKPHWIQVEEWRRILDALAAQAREPVGVVKIVPYGSTLSPDRQVRLFTADLDDGALLYTAPQPAAPASMAELEKALDRALDHRAASTLLEWNSKDENLKKQGRETVEAHRAHALRLASAGVVPSVTREALLARLQCCAEHPLEDDTDFVTVTVGELFSALRALGIEVKS